MDNTGDDIVLRLKKIEGQVRGLQRLIGEHKDCVEIVHQVAAARKALDKVGFLILTQHLQVCMQNSGEDSHDCKEAVEEAMRLFLTLA